MKRKIKFKLPFFIILFAFVPILLLVASISFNEKKPDNEQYIESTEIDSYPVISEDNKISFPYSNEKVKVGKKYYDYKGEEKNQEDSLIIHDNTYYQNSGIDYVSEESFDVLSILEGTVLSVREDENVGKVVEIKHDNDLISIYQSLSEVSVKKDDIVTKGQVIGKSGTNEMDKELGNHLHLEIYENGKTVDPEAYLGKTYEKKN